MSSSSRWRSVSLSWSWLFVAFSSSNSSWAAARILAARSISAWLRLMLLASSFTRALRSSTLVLSTFIFCEMVRMNTSSTAPKPQQMQSRKARLKTSVSRRLAAMDMVRGNG